VQSDYTEADRGRVPAEGGDGDEAFPELHHPAAQPAQLSAAPVEGQEGLLHWGEGRLGRMVGSVV